MVQIACRTLTAKRFYSLFHCNGQTIKQSAPENPRVACHCQAHSYSDQGLELGNYLAQGPVVRKRAEDIQAALLSTQRSYINCVVLRMDEILCLIDDISLQQLTPQHEKCF